jgi:tricorn protease
MFNIHAITSMRILQASLITYAVLLNTSVARANEPIRLARTPDISPDGKTIAVSCFGNIWTVDAGGGPARQVTRDRAHDINPIFSPDGRSLAYSSNRHGSYDVFVVAADGGQPRRLTFDSAADHPTDWSPDGKTILFTSARNPGYPLTQEVYSVPADGGTERRVSMAGGRDGVFSPRGDLIAYVRGDGAWFRKGYRGSSNDDIWVSDSDGSHNRQLTTFSGQDGSPMWSADGQYVYYVSELFGTPANIVRQDVAGRRKPMLVTADPGGKPFHKDEGVRRARISRNGEWVVYECGADIWLCPTREGGQPRKLLIEVPAVEKDVAARVVSFTNGATEYALSPDERHVAFVVHGEIFLVPTGGSSDKAKRLTDSPANDHGIAWAPDGSKIIFTSDRGGYENLYLLESDDPAHPNLAEADKFKVKQITDTHDGPAAVSFHPSGHWVGFLRGGQLWTMDPDGTRQRVVVRDRRVINYERSPDSKWVAYSQMDGSFASELYVMPSYGGEGRNVTRYATYNAGISWSRECKQLAFISERHSPGGGTFPSLFVLSLQKPAAPGASPGNDIDWEEVHLRVEQPVPHLPIREGTLSPDGGKLAFATSGSGSDLWVAGASGGQLLRLTSGGGAPPPDPVVEAAPRRDLFPRRLWTDSQGQCERRRPGGPLRAALGRGGLGVVPFEATMTVRDGEVFLEMFDQAWRALSDHFYDRKMHGADWEAVRRTYRPLVSHVIVKEDLYYLLYLMMGELNASNVGVWGPPAAPDGLTADLGLLFDETYRGPGLKVAEVLRRGPADRRGLNLKPGDYVLGLDGAEVADGFNLSKMLNGKVDGPVLLAVSSDPPSGRETRRTVELRAFSRDRSHKLLYERWAGNNARRVAELSKGKMGYIHIPSMDAEGLDRFVRALYSDNFDKEAIVLDVRNNRGGCMDGQDLSRLVRPSDSDNYDEEAIVLGARNNRGAHNHAQILSYLGAKDHTVFWPRDSKEAAVLRSDDRKWTKPVVLLINNRSYADAEIFASAFKALGLGKLVGQMTGAHVIGTGDIRLIDGSQFRVPHIAVFNIRGENMEKGGVAPDVAVDVSPDPVSKGVDPQLDKAVEVLQAGVFEWKKNQ